MGCRKPSVKWSPTSISRKPSQSVFCIPHFLETPVGTTCRINGEDLENIILTWISVKFMTLWIAEFYNQVGGYQFYETTCYLQFLLWKRI
jgi:hypothetical protein